VLIIALVSCLLGGLLIMAVTMIFLWYMRKGPFKRGQSISKASSNDTLVESNADMKDGKPRENSER